MGAAPPLSKATSLASYVRVLRAVGAPVESELRRARLPVLFEERLGTWIPYASMRQFLARMCAREGITDLGDRASDLAERGCTDPRFRAAVLRAPTLYSALEVFTRHVRFQSTGITAWLEWREDALRVCHAHVLGPEVPGCAILDAHASRQVVDFVRVFLGRTWQPAHVVYRARPPEWREWPAPDVPFASAGVTSEMHADHGGIDIPLEALSAPNPARSRGSGDDDLAYPTTMTDALRSALSAYLPEARPSIEIAAALMSCSSVRTLQRNLAEEHATYREILALAALDVACEYLEHSDLTLTEVALRLGYSELSAFSRAFRDWTGMSPSRYRARRPGTEPAAPALVAG